MVVNNSINGAASMHQDKLLALNENPEDYRIVEVAKSGGLVEKNAVNRSAFDMLEYINNYGDIPMSNAKNRSKK